MRLVSFEAGGAERIGALSADRSAVVDLSAAGLPRDMNELIALGAGGLERARRATGDAAAPLIPLHDLRLLAPIPRPLRNIICVGKNYHEHANEFHASGFDSSAGAAAIPEHPIFFTKAPIA